MIGLVLMFECLVPKAVCRANSEVHPRIRLPRKVQLQDHFTVHLFLKVCLKLGRVYVLKKLRLKAFEEIKLLTKNTKQNNQSKT